MVLDEMKVKGCFYKELSLSPTQVLFLLSCLTQNLLYQVLLCLSPSCLIYWGEKDHRFCWDIRWKPGLGKKPQTCCPGQISEFKKKHKKNSLVARRRKCCNVQTENTQSSGWSVTALHLYVSEKFTEIPTFYCFLLPGGMWQFQNINFEMSLSFKQ